MGASLFPFPDRFPDTLEPEPVWLEIDGFYLLRTSPAAPEQYDVFKDGVQVGYLRLRHGRFRVEFPDCGGELIYDARPEGEAAFMDHEQREFLKNAVTAIAARLKRTD